MRYIVLTTLILLTLNSVAQVKNFMFIGMDRKQLKNTKTWANNGTFDGVQVAYSWNQLEPQKDEYDFSLIEKDLKLLKRYGKKLFIQIQDVSFSMKWNLTPQYLKSDAVYNGGANVHYKSQNAEQSSFRELGWITRRWDKAVQDRLHKLYAALGKEFDGIIEGINTEETAVEYSKEQLHPPGFSFERYRDATLENIIVLKKAFPKSTVIVYANFMPGGYLPGGDSTLLKSVYEFAQANNIGVGGPDLFPYKKGQMDNSYRFIKDSYEKVPTSLAVQDGNYNYINPQTNKPVTAKEIYEFANKYLHLTYIFWGTEEPYFHRETMPFLRSLKDKSKNGL